MHCITQLHVLYYIQTCLLSGNNEENHNSYAVFLSTAFEILVLKKRIEFIAVHKIRTFYVFIDNTLILVLDPLSLIVVKVRVFSHHVRLMPVNQEEWNINLIFKFMKLYISLQNMSFI